MLTKNQESKIIDFLKSNYKIPSSGLIAGQAVASLVYKELRLNLNQPINDVDVFVKKSTNDKSVFSNCRKEFFNNIVSHDNQGSNMETVFSSSFSRGYQVLNSYYLEEDSRVNVINYNAYSEDERQKIVDSFDLNCCSVGFEIETGEFYYSTAFIEFVKTLQLRVQSVHTPFHTMLRINKKIKDLGGDLCCDKNLERFILIKAIQVNNSKNGYFIVGKRFFKSFAENKDVEFEKMINLFVHENDNDENPETYYHLRLDREYLNSDYYLKNIHRKENAEAKDLLDIKEDISSFNQSHMPFHCETAREIDNESFFWGMNSVSMTTMLHLIYDTSLFNKKYTKKLINFCNELGKNRFSVTILNSILEASPLTKISGDFPIKKAKRVSKLIKQHQNIVLGMRAEPKETSFMESLDKLSEIYLMVKNNSEKSFVIGLIEIGKINFTEALSVKEMNMEDSVKHLIDIGDEELMKSKLSFKNNNFSLFGVKVKQLNSLLDFYNAGVEGKHCILGHYYLWSTNEEMKYFRLEYKGKVSHIQLSEEYILQHFGYKNKVVSDLENKLGFLLLLISSNKKKNIINKKIKMMKQKSSYYRKTYLFVEKVLVKTGLKKSPLKMSMGGCNDDIPF